jgi:hypothetical protein
VWRTAKGERVLGDKERTLFVHAAAALLGHLLDEAREDDPDEGSTWHTGVALFDRTEPQARIVLLRDVVQALTDPAVPTPSLRPRGEQHTRPSYRLYRHGPLFFAMICVSLQIRAWDRKIIVANGFDASGQQGPCASGP